MRLLVRMFDPRLIVVQRPGRIRRRYNSDSIVTIETKVTRIFRDKPGGTLYAHGFMPERYALIARPECYQSDGTYLFEVNEVHNRKTLEPFFASGLNEMNVTEVES
jgi:hypothetical protein